MYSVFESLLKQHHCTAKKVSDATGIATSTFTDWKKGRYRPKIDKLQKIADFFEVSVSVFYESEEAESVKARVTDWHQAMTTDDPDLFLYNKYKADPVFWENIRLLFYLPTQKKETVYAVIRGQVLTTAEEEKKEGINSTSSKVG